MLKLSRTLVLAVLGYFACFGAGLAASDGKTYGLLVGVSNYPNLAKRYQLEGPDNDVELMRQVLQRRGVPDKHITVLKSAGDRRPTRGNIIGQLKALAAKAKKGDFVYLHFAGHGSQQPARPGDLEEGDGLDEIFLPEDAGKWQDKIGEVERSISDNEFNELITAIRAKGAFVWAVFDSCHSGTMLRSVSNIKWRNVNPGALGIPSRRRARRGKPTASAHYSQPSPLAAHADAFEGADAGGKGGFVAFYASQTDEQAPELALPEGLKPQKRHGMLSYALAEAMTGAPDVSYRQLGQIVLQKYVKAGLRATTPLIEGSQLDAGLFDGAARPAPRQWPVTLRGGSRTKRLYAPAGRLNQIGDGAVFAIMRDPGDEDEQAIGYVQAKFVEMFGVELEPIAYAGKNAVRLRDVPRSAYARVIRPSFSFGLTVSLPDPRHASTGREKRMLQAVRKLAGAPVGQQGGLKLEWVAPDAPADVRLVFTPASRDGQDEQAPDCPRNHLWFADQSGALVCEGARKNISLAIGDPSARFDENIAKTLRATLNAIGKVQNLEQMVERFQRGGFGRKLDVKLYHTSAATGIRHPLDLSSREPLSAGDRIQLEVKNNTIWPVDVTILFVDSSYGIAALFPSGGRTNRIEPGRRITDVAGEITADTLGLEGMIVFATKAATGAPVADFSFLQQASLNRTTRVRAMGGASRQALDEETQSFDALVASAGFGQKAAMTRSAGRRSAPKRTPYKRVTVKSLRWIVGAD